MGQWYSREEKKKENYAGSKTLTASIKVKETHWLEVCFTIHDCVFFWPPKPNPETHLQGTIAETRVSSQLTTAFFFWPPKPETHLQGHPCVISRLHFSRFDSVSNAVHHFERCFGPKVCWLQAMCDDDDRIVDSIVDVWRVMYKASAFHSFTVNPLSSLYSQVQHHVLLFCRLPSPMPGTGQRNNANHQQQMLSTMARSVWCTHAGRRSRAVRPMHTVCVCVCVYVCVRVCVCVCVCARTWSRTQCSTWACGARGKRSRLVRLMNTRRNCQCWLCVPCTFLLFVVQSPQPRGDIPVCVDIVHFNFVCDAAVCGSCADKNIRLLGFHWPHFWRASYSKPCCSNVLRVCALRPLKSVCALEYVMCIRVCALEYVRSDRWNQYAH